MLLKCQCPKRAALDIFWCSKRPPPLPKLKSSQIDPFTIRNLIPVLNEAKPKKHVLGAQPPNPWPVGDDDELQWFSLVIAKTCSELPTFTAQCCNLERYCLAKIFLRGDPHTALVSLSRQWLTLETPYSSSMVWKFDALLDVTSKACVRLDNSNAMWRLLYTEKELEFLNQVQTQTILGDQWLLITLV
jgi:hypothetical protein